MVKREIMEIVSKQNEKTQKILLELIKLFLEGIKKK